MIFLCNWKVKQDTSSVIAAYVFLGGIIEICMFADYSWGIISTMNIVAKHKHVSHESLLLFR